MIINHFNDWVYSKGSSNIVLALITLPQDQKGFIVIYTLNYSKSLNRYTTNSEDVSCDDCRLHQAIEHDILARKRNLT